MDIGFFYLGILETQDNYISTSDYSAKYGLELRKLAPACVRWHETKDRPGGAIGLISEKRTVQIKSGLRRTKGFATRSIWFVLDVHPSEHPYDRYLEVVKRFYQSTWASDHKKGKFDLAAPKLLEKYDNRPERYRDRTIFSITELAEILQTRKDRIRYWASTGLEDYGKLPKTIPPKGHAPIKDEDGNYAQSRVVNFYFHHRDIRRWFKKELVNPENLMRSNEDKFIDNNLEEIKEESNYFTFNPMKVAPMTFDGFMSWARENIWMTDRASRRKIRFVPNDKQVEFYKAALTLKKNGTFKHRILGACRPRGDYKSFDVALLTLFRFFNMPEEAIFYVTNSVEQTSHLLMKEARKIIKRSPTLSMTPGLEFRNKNIYLQSGKGEENVFNSIEMIAVSSGARSNATCFAFSEVWKLTDESNVVEIEQSTRGVDNAWVLFESTVSPTGHFFHRYYTAHLEGENESLFFQYYNGEERRNPKIDDEFLRLAKKVYPFHHKAFFDNKWEDATDTIFTPAMIKEMGYISYSGSYYRSKETEEQVNNLVSLEIEIKKFDKAIDTTFLIQRKAEITSLFQPVSYVYTLPAPDNILHVLKKIYGCNFVVGIGLDRSKQLTALSDRTVLATVARGIMEYEKWNTDRIFFVLDLYIPEESTIKLIMQRIQENAQKYARGVVYIDLEDYNVLDLKEACEDYGYDTQISTTSPRHQDRIFTEMATAVAGGFFKCPDVPIYVNPENKIIHSLDPIHGQTDILRDEMSAFEYEPPLSSNRAGRYGSKFKRGNKMTTYGQQKDDTVYAIAHAMNASIRGDIPANIVHSVMLKAIINYDVAGAY